MPVGKTTQPRWVYDCDCRNCQNIQPVCDPTHHRNGNYCLPAIQAVDAGKPWTGLHADDDRHLRCDFYLPRK